MPDAGFTIEEPDPRATLDAVEMVRLAALDPVAYERERTAAARRLGMRGQVLDAEVKKLQAVAVERDRRTPAFSDEALALAFTAQHSDRLRFVAKWNKWVIWNGTVWLPDDKLAVFDLCRAAARAASAMCDRDIAASIASAKTVAAIERLSRADQRHAETVDAWDVDPWLLNTPGGVVDLRTGITREHRPGDLLTKITAVAPAGDCPQWLRFLDWATCHDRELRDYLQRVSGYLLTGSTREHSLFFGYGTGGNGKGTFLNTIAAVLRGYATNAPMETFTASHGDRHPTELAMLRGARLVTSEETEEGRPWAEARIKALTGGDPITARFMHQDFFTFRPTFKLFITGNHKPALRNVDEAMRRRFNMVYFAAKITPANRDTTLPERLKAEWPGILRWAIEGCLDWQRIGLAPPPAVTAATAEYFETEDAMKAWLDDSCDVDGGYSDGSTALYESFRRWSERSGERPMSQKRFSQAMQARGHATQRTRYGMMMNGLRLKPSSHPHQPASDA